MSRPSRQDEESENDLIRQIYNVVAQRCGNRHSADAVNQDGRMTLTAKLEFIKEYCVAAAANNLLVPPPNAGVENAHESSVNSCQLVPPLSSAPVGPDVLTGNYHQEKTNNSPPC